MRIRRLHSNRHLRSGRESRRDFKLERSRWVAVLQHPNWSLAKVWAESSPDRAPPNGDVGRQRKPSSDLMRDRIASPPSRSNEPGLQGPRPASGDFWVLAGPAQPSILPRPRVPNLPHPDAGRTTATRSGENVTIGSPDGGCPHFSRKPTGDSDRPPGCTPRGGRKITYRFPRGTVPFSQARIGTVPIGSAGLKNRGTAGRPLLYASSNGACGCSHGRRYDRRNRLVASSSPITVRVVGS